MKAILRRNVINTLLICGLVANSDILNAQTDSLAKEKFTFEPDREAKEAVGKIVKYTGLSPNFTVVAGDVSTALAYIKGGKRYIAYNPEFIVTLKNKTQTNWGAVSVLAHEIGHHLSGHTLKSKSRNPGDELAADKFSGFILYQMGASLDEALSALKSLNFETDTLKHPPVNARKEAVTNGWLEAQALVNIKAYEEKIIAPANEKNEISLVYKCRFDDDDNLYFVDDKDRIIWFDNYGKPILIGHKRASETRQYIWIYSYNEYNYGIDSKGKIWYETTPGMISIIGRVEELKKSSE